MQRNLIRSAATLVAFAAVSASASAQYYPAAQGYGNDYGQARTVRCESVESRQAFCRVDTRGGVRLAHQLSRQQCVRGRNWNADANGISVRDGCRADFVVTPGGYARDDYGRGEDDRYRGQDRADRYGRIRCEARATGRTYCGERGVRYGVADNRNPNCLPGRTWGSDERGTWVSGNCDADFVRVGATGGSRSDGAYRNGIGQVVHCTSSDYNYQRNYCGDPRSSYTLGADRSRRCVEGRTWGTDQRGVWVSGGCDADFIARAYGDRRQGGYGDDSGGYRNGDDGYRQGSGDYRDVACRSTRQGRSYCDERDGQYFIRDGGNADCVEGVTYGRDGNGTWVAGDCEVELRDEAYRGL
jgi:hypothetical protein